MNKYIFLLFTVLSFSFYACDESENNDEEIDFDEEIAKIEEEEGLNYSKMEQMEEKMEEIMYDADTSNNALKSDVVVIDKQSVNSADVEIHIGAGTLRLTGGSSELLTGGFKYSKNNFKPDINYKKNGEKGVLKISQKRRNNLNMDDGDKNIWNLKFNNELPLSFNVTLGAGISEILLHDMNIEQYNMVMGVGQTTIDLRGKWDNSAEIHLDGGIGLAKLYLPQDVGISLKVEKGLGDIEIHNLEKVKKGEYVNGAVSNSKVQLTIHVKAGIGKIEVN